MLFVETIDSRHSRENRIIESDPAKIIDHKIKIIGQLKKEPGIADTMDILLDYKAPYCKYYSGFSGLSDSSGFSGSSGGTGCDGEDGEHGSYGPDLEVYVDVYYDTLIHANLMSMSVTELGTANEYKYLINTEGGSIAIISEGGDGGNGGSGGNGFNGEYITREIQINDNTVVTETIQLPGGNGGNGGDGGYIYVYYTTYAAPYLGMLHIQSIGGDGGNGGSGGSSGSGGPGGSGYPSGNSGSSGVNGRDGYPGEVFYYELVEE